MRDMNVASVGAIKIPEHCIVNSRAHMSKYCTEKNLIGDYDGAFFRNLPSQSEFKKVHTTLTMAMLTQRLCSACLPWLYSLCSTYQVHTLSVDEKWQMLLLSGVAAHVPLEPMLNPQGDTSYTNYVAEQMEKGALAVCGVTKDFTYGANVPCTSVLVDRDFITNHSANTLRQFIGRVARTGLAPYGVAQFQDDSFLPKMCGKADEQEAACMQATAEALLARPASEQ